MEEKRKRGRPPKPKSDIKPEPKKMGRPKSDTSRASTLPMIRIHEHELERLKKAASFAGVPFAEWVREQLLAAVEAQLRAVQDNDSAPQ